MHKKLLCDICSEKIATVHYTEIVNNKLKKMDLCEECARKKNIGINVQFSVADILKGLTETKVAEEADTSKACPHCGLTFAKFRKVGRLGCSECYDAFQEELLPILADIHKNTEHVGVKPEKVKSGKSSPAMKLRAQLDELNSQLESAVKNEEYEDAAVFRDKIKSLREKMEKKGKSK